MLKAFLMSNYEWLKFGYRLFIAVPYAGARPFIPRLLAFSLLWPLCGLLNLFHWLFFAIDEVLFSAYRKVKVDHPFFIIGIPRSGTTWLQRVIADDPQMTSLTLWECVFAPSVTQRYIVQLCSKILRPVVALIPAKRPQWFTQFDAIHQLGLSEPEEDFLLLLPLHACFLTILLCPTSKHYWKLAQFDTAFSENHKKTVMHFYYRCLQKHLYFHGQGKRFLSKNPSFTPFIESLHQQFPDAHFVACVREPEATVPSQLSSLLPAAKSLGIATLKRPFIENMVDLLQHYYGTIQRLRVTHKLEIVDNAALAQDLKGVVTYLYKVFAIELSDAYAARLSELNNNSKRFKSQHQYDFAGFELQKERIIDRFSPYWDHISEPQMANK